MSSDQVKIDATKNANIIVGGINAALDGNKAMDKFGKMLQEATERGVQKGIEQGVKNTKVKEVEIKTKVKKPDTSELKNFKYELSNGVELNLSKKLSKQDESDVRGLVKKISGLVEKEFQKPPVASYNAVKKNLPELKEGQIPHINTAIDKYKKKLSSSGINASEQEIDLIREQYISIRRTRNAIEEIESTINDQIKNVKYDASSIRDVSKTIQELYRLKLVLNDLNKPDNAQLTDRRTLDFQNPEKAKKELEKYKKNVIDNLFSLSGFNGLIKSSNESGKFNVKLFDKVNARYKAVSDKSILLAEKNAQKAEKEQKKYTQIFSKMSQFRGVTSDQSERYLTKLSNEIIRNKYKDSSDISPTKSKNLIGYYLAYKNAGKNPSDINPIFDEWMKVFSSDLSNNEFLPYYKAINEVFSLTDEQFKQKLAELKAPEIDTKPVEKSEEKIRKEVQKTDKVIEDSKKKREEGSSKNNNQDNSKYLDYAKPDKTYSEDKWNYAKSRQIPYKLELGKDFTTEDAKKSKKQVLDTYKLYNEFLEREKLDTYLGTIAEYRFFKSYSDAASKGIQFQFDDEITDNGYLNSKLSNGSYAWEKKLKLSKARLLMYASVNDQIENADKSIFKQINLSDDIQRLVYHMFISKYHKDNNVRSINLEQAVEAQNDINQIIEKATGKKNVLTVVSADSIPSKPKVESKSKEDNKPKVESKPKEESKENTKPKEDKPKIESKSNDSKKSSPPQSTQTPKPKPKQEEKSEEAPREVSKPEVKNQPPVTNPTPATPKPLEEKPIEQAKDQAEALNEVEDAAEKAAGAVDKLDDKTKKAGKSAEKTQKNVKKENEEFKDTQKQATAAATAKLDFDSANQKVADGAEESSKSIDKEKKSLKDVSEGISEEEVLNRLEGYDKLTTVENKSGDVSSYTGSITEKTDSAYVTTTQKYKANEDGDFELAYTSIVEDVKKLKSENSKNEEKIRKSNDKLDKFINNIDLQMGGKINAMQLHGYSGLKHISSVDEIDDLVKKMQDLDTERKRLFDSSKTNRKDLFGINGLTSEVNGIISSFNQLKSPTDELSDSITKMIDARDKLEGASGIYEQAEAAGILRDCINESNIALKEQQRIERDNQKLSDVKKKDEILAYKKLISGQELDEYEKKLQNTSKLSDDVKSNIANLRTDLSKVSSNTDMALFNNRFKVLKNTVKTTPVDSNNFQNNWDKWLSIIDRNNASQNFGNINLPNENNSAFNDINAISEYITNKVKQATNLSKNISKLQNDLSKEISKSSDQQNTQIINGLKNNIESDKKSLESIINNDLFKDKDKFISKDITNAYRDAELNLRKSSDNLKNTETNKPIIDQYNTALSKVKELEKAQNNLLEIQNKQFGSPYNDMSQDIEAAKNEVASLKHETENLFQSEDIKNKSILGDKKVNDLQDYYDKVNKNSENNRKLEGLMVDAYRTYRNAEKKVFNNIGTSDSKGLSFDIARMEVYKKEYDRLKAEISSIKGNDYQNPEILNLEESFNDKNTKLLNQNISSVSDAIENFKNKFGNKNGAASIMANDFIKPYEDAFNKVKDKISEGKKLSSEDFDDIFNVKKAIEEGPGSLSDGFIRKYNEAYKLLDKLGSYTNIKGKSSSYGSILQSFTKEINDLVNDKNMPDEDKIKKIIDIYDRLYDFSKNSKAFDLNNNKGKLIEGTESYMKSAEDVVNYLRDYAEKFKLGKEISSSISDTGQVTMQFQNQNGAVTTLKGSIEQYTQALRMMNNEQTKTGSSFNTLGNALKSIAGGTMKDVLGMFSSYFSGYRIMSTMINQIQQGFTTLKAYDDSMTTISYTMNMTQSQLDSLGSSAIDMAKDLSMSLDNAMSIYQIYANMNTTAQEIQETAKPTAILSNLSGVDTATAADQVQGILQQFNMLEDGSVSAADASMHVVDVLDKISSNVAIDYAKGIKVISDAVQASGQVAYDAGMTYEQLAAVTAKVAERTREDGGTIGNAIKTNNCLCVQKCA